MNGAVLLDVDGTLIDSNAQHAQAWARALERFGYHVDAERLRGWIGMGGDKILARVDPNLDADSGTGAAIGNLRMELFLREYLPDLAPTNGARNLLEWLRRASLRRVIATSAKEAELSAILRQAGIDARVDLAVTSDDVDRSKPDADIVHAALRKADCAAPDAVYIGDTRYDIQAAHRAGVAVIALRCGGSNGASLAGADAVYDDPADLLARIDSSPLMRLSKLDTRR